MLKFLVIGIVILVVIFLLMRAFSRKPKEPGGREPPKMITMEDGDIAAEIDGQELAIDPTVLDEIKRLAGSGQKLEAIKRLREATGLSLAEAKTIVDSLDRMRK
jgi:ribosomal protein L7/L12